MSGHQAPRTTGAKPARQLALALAWLGFALAAPAAIKPGDAFPKLSTAGLATLSGGEVPATEGKVVLVDFWASWCAPCKASFPAMAKLHRDFAARGLEIVAVSIDEKPASAAAFWKRMTPPFAGLHDREQKLVQQVEVPTMPTSYLLDRQGRVRFVHEGFHGESSDRAMRQEIETLLAEQH